MNINNPNNVTMQELIAIMKDYSTQITSHPNAPTHWSANGSGKSTFSGADEVYGCGFWNHSNPISLEKIDAAFSQHNHYRLMKIVKVLAKQTCDTLGDNYKALDLINIALKSPLAETKYHRYFIFSKSVDDRLENYKKHVEQYIKIEEQDKANRNKPII